MFRLKVYKSKPIDGNNVILEIKINLNLKESVK
jgi:hypothetical protein